LEDFLFFGENASVGFALIPSTGVRHERERRVEREMRHPLLIILYQCRTSCHEQKVLAELPLHPNESERIRGKKERIFPFLSSSESHLLISFWMPTTAVAPCRVSRQGRRKRVRANREEQQMQQQEKRSLCLPATSGLILFPSLVRFRSFSLLSPALPACAITQF
jgi:hypothetical protein